VFMQKGKRKHPKTPHPEVAVDYIKRNRKREKTNTLVLHFSTLQRSIFNQHASRKLKWFKY
jgi:hypothetical protein